VAARRPPAVRKQVIVDAAARLFGERGYAAVGMDEIGAAVEVSGPSLYWHFPSKQALLAEVVVAASDRFAAALAALAAATPEPAFADVVAVELAVVLDDPGSATTLLREADRLSGEDHGRVVANQVANAAVAVPALIRLNPALGPEAAGARLFAQLGAFSAVARQRAALPRARLDAVVTRAVMSLALAPPRPPGPPRPETGWTPVGARPDAIVQAARGLFRTRGFAEVSMQDIAAAAGLSRPTLYRYFANKGEILDEAWDREGMRFVVGAREALAAASSAADAVGRLADAYVRVSLDCLDLVDLMFRQHPPVGPDAAPSRHSAALRDAWGSAVVEARPDLAEAEAGLVTEMALGVAAYAALIAGGRHEWHDEIVSLVTATVLG
jgi:AcrR family transcriptional regulator